ncbi:MAG: glycosyltransferase [Clostridia bacterium]|nr:glycosyltransferase [Clostridia bacterium]
MKKDNTSEKGQLNSPNVVFCGNFVPEGMVNSHKGIAVSGNRMILGIIKAIETHCNLSLISVMPIASFPKEKKIFIKGGKSKLYDAVEYLKIFFINVFGLKQLTQITSLKKALKKVVKDKENPVIVNFNPYVTLSIPTLKYAKKHNIKTVCIVADIPVTVPKHYNFIKKAFRRLEINKYHNNIGKYDGLIVLNENVINEFAKGKPYYLMDGGVTEKEIENTKVVKPENHDNLQILYTGALESYNGIKEMIEGFLMVEKNLKLTICGGGTLSSYVQDMANKYENIEFKGLVPHDEVVKLQANAGLLISTRPIDGFALKLTFPSKMIEYMLSGTPILTTKLNGLTKDYEDKLFFCGQTPNEIAVAISNFFDLSIEDRYKTATTAREFIKNKKTYTYHSKGVMNLINEVLSK